MPKLTYKSLFELVNTEIDKKIQFRNTKGFRTQSAITTARKTDGGIAEIRVSEVVTALQELMSSSLPGRIDEGLAVTETDPISDSIIITAGKGSAGGFLYELEEDVTIKVPFNDTASLYYVNLYQDRIMIDTNKDSKKLTIAKIVIPSPGDSYRVRSDKDDSYDAYIVNFREYSLFGDANGKFEEDTIELLRDNISPILADNIIGSLTLSEHLKITNISGSLEIDSDSLKIINPDGFVLSKFTKDGMFINDAAGREIAKFTGSEARIGNIKVTPTALQSGNFVTGSTGFQIKDDGNVEFNNLTVRGTVYATAGIIGGWTIEEDKIYATDDGGVIQTGQNVGAGANGVVLDRDGLRVYDDVLGVVANFPSDGSVPTISSGIINEVIFEISTNAVIRTSETVGDGTSDSYGLLMNNTGLYGVGANQLLADANFKLLTDGSAYFKGEIVAASGNIGGVTISSDRLVGGTIQGALLIGATIETSETLPRILMNSEGLSYEVTSNVGTYGEFDYGDGTLYGVGILAKLFDTNYPVLAVLSEQDKADIRLYDRANDPITGTHQPGDLICVSGVIKRCSETLSGGIGLFDSLVSSDETTGGVGDAGAGNQYVEVNINNSIYKLLYTT